ncbi:type VI secretion system Vgr family protein [Paenalcaligenes faecalis]|uniref:type VI secretion system Vgr family protein n=1 Tax=Paenalcaligenes faecalis TaxID=2980099 RepID=UPI0022B9C1F0|nr:type VI secretion system tip protein TssI/VgrG [Paenalcaligenes faecalis]
MNRVVIAHSPLGTDLLFKQLVGTEGLSCVFEFELELLSENASIDAAQLLGKGIGLEIQVDEISTRYLNGDVVSFSYIGQELGGRRLARYRAQVRPWLWYLGRNQDCKIYQNMTVVDILDEVLGSYPQYDYNKRLSGSYEPYEFCVQYEESDLDFVHRLMEQEGVYYYFEHAKDKHILVLCDEVSAHDPLPHQPLIRYFPSDANALAQEQTIYAWRTHQQLQGVEYVVDDYDFKKSTASLRQQRRVPYSVEQANREVYDWQTGYADPDQGEHYVRVRVEQAQAAASRIEGQANTRALAPGYVFTLIDSPRRIDLKDYLIVSVRYYLTEAGYYSADAIGPGEYRFDFIAQDAQLVYRAPLVTPKPKTSGPQTAIVTGPAGAEVYTDEFQRIKVHFRWDRYGVEDQHSSCWIRVSNDSAGAGFGSVVPPRVGQEVIVDFIGGNPDRPVVTGRVYNDKQMPAFSPSPTQSGFVSRSFGGGSAANANHLIFEDAAGSEQIQLHAERDFIHSVEMNTEQTVGVNHQHSVGNNYDVTVGNTKQLTVGNDSFVTIGNNLRTEIDNNEHRTVGAEQHLQVGSMATQLYKDRLTTHVQGDAIHSYEQKVDVVALGNVHEDYRENYHFELTGNKTSTVQGTENKKVEGDSLNEYKGNYTRRVTGKNEVEYKSDSIRIYNGPCSSTYNVTDFSFAPLLQVIWVGGVKITNLAAMVNHYGFKSDIGFVEFKNAMKTLKTAAQSETASITKKEFAMVKAKANVVTRSMIAMKQQKVAMDSKMVGMKKQIGALDTRVNALTSVT